MTTTDSGIDPAAASPVTPDPLPEASGDSFISRLIGVAVAPGPTFARIAARPTWGAMLALIVIAASMAAFVVSSKLDQADMRQHLRAQTSSQLEKAGRQISDAELDKAVDIQMRITKVMVLAGPPVIVPIFALIASLYYWGIFVAFGARLTFRQVFSWLLFGTAPAVAKAILAIPIALAKSSVAFTEMNTLVTANLSPLVDPSSNALLYAVLATIDVFLVWTFWLRIRGARELPEVGRGVAIGAATLGFVVAVGFGTVGILNMVKS